MNNPHNHQEKTNGHAPLRILLIEDSDTDAYLIEREINKHMENIEYTRVPALKPGEEILQKGKADVLLLDLGLPDTASPADTYAQIKKWTDKVPVIILTNMKDHDLARVMVHEGAADFINKDVIGTDRKILQDAIDFSIERHAAHRKTTSEKEKAVKDSKEKDTILRCFMGGYSIGSGK